MKLQDEAVIAQREFERATGHLDRCRRVRNKAVNDLLDQGWSTRQVARLVGLSQPQILRLGRPKP